MSKKDLYFHVHQSSFFLLFSDDGVVLIFDESLQQLLPRLQLLRQQVQPRLGPGRGGGGGRLHPVGGPRGGGRRLVALRHQVSVQEEEVVVVVVQMLRPLLDSVGEMRGRWRRRRMLVVEESMMG